MGIEVEVEEVAMVHDVLPDLRPSRIDDPIVAAMARAIVERWDPLKIILFGSRARGDMRADSDADFLIVVPPALKSRATTVAMLDSLNVEPRYAVDLVLTTPEELEEYGSICGLVYFYALREGLTLYERRSL